MATTVLPGQGEFQPGRLNRTRLSVTVVLIVWFLLVLWFGTVGVFVGQPGTPPFAIAIGVAIPLLLFLAWMRVSHTFHEYVLSLDVRLIAGIQAWRWAGLGFLTLYAYNVLPAVFALPAGLGDMAIGFTAPWILLALLRRPDFAASRAFIRWNLLGILDLVVAVSIGALSTLFATGAPGEISTAPMATLPLVLIPTYLVPVFLMLHATALMQSRQLIRNRR